MSDSTRRPLSGSPAQLLVTLALSIFAAETCVMLLLTYLRPVLEQRSPWVENLLDSTLLVAVLLPALYVLMFRPLIRRATELARTQAALSEANYRARSEETLRASEERYRSLFENMREGFAYCRLLYDNDEPTDLVYLEVNSAFGTLTGLQDVIGNKLTEVIPGIGESNPELLDVFGRVARTGQSESLEAYLEPLGAWLAISVYSSESEHFIAVFDNITARKQAQEASALFRALIDQSNDAIEVLDPETGRFLDSNQKAWMDLGYSRDEFLSLTLFDIDPMFSPAAFAASNAGLLESGFRIVESQHRRKDGSLFPVEVNVTHVQLDRSYIVAVIRDITDRRQRERELQSVATLSAALRAASSRAQLVSIVVGQVMKLLNVDGAMIAMRDSVTGETVHELGGGEWAALTGLRLSPGEGIAGHVMATGMLYLTNDVASDVHAAGVDVRDGIRAVACTPLSAGTETFGTLTVGHTTALTPEDIELLTSLGDIAANAIHRAALHEQTERHVQRLAALHTIDTAVSASLDLRVSVSVLLEQVITQLRADAADVLRFNPHLQTLEYVAGRGFRTKRNEQLRLRLGECNAGVAVLERRTSIVPNMACDPGSGCEEWSAGEDFVAQYAVPLIAKGQVVGVLEVFQRSTLDPDADWLDFLETLAGQAAIAIESASLFDGLQRSNTELTSAYNATIEGWSRALDLRDHETEGHSLRVTETTLKLAEAMGLDDAALVHIRRGALLHDIGKMGVPDSVLLKPGPLSDEEWDLMKMHPDYAYEMLSPIEYLKPALDIPYCHHERWDGTGYPRGLKGETIPLSARIFAVVDVWDALRSDRPYRKGWPDDRVRAHLLEQTGKHFDPRVMERFLGDMYPQE